MASFNFQSKYIIKEYTRVPRTTITMRFCEAKSSENLCPSVGSRPPIEVIGGLDIKDDVILITGGGRGLGKHLAIQYAKHNPKKIILWDINEKNLKETCTYIKREWGYNIVYNVCDIIDYSLVDKLLSDIRKEHGGVTLLVNNAGVLLETGPAHTARISRVKKTFDVNTFAQINLTSKVLPLMLSRSKGHIVQISSIASLIPIPQASAYSASKFAITGYMDCLRTELYGKGINTTVICPHQITTDLFNGATTRLELLLPPLSPSYVAEQTVEATLTNTEFMIIPRLLYAIYLIRKIVPLEAWSHIESFTRVNTAMDSYRNVLNEQT